MCWLISGCQAHAMPEWPRGLYLGGIGFWSSTDLIAQFVLGKASLISDCWQLYFQCSWIQKIPYGYF